MHAGPDPPPASTENALAYARALLAIWAATAVYLDPTEPTRFAAFAYTTLVAYAAASIAYAVAVRRHLHLPERWGRGAHIADLVLAAVVSMLTDGPNSPFFVFFVYALLSAALRWGGRATLATAGAGIGLLLAEAALLEALAPAEHAIELNRVLMRVAHLGVLGMLVGRLSEAARRSHIESTAAARIVTEVRGAGARRAMEPVIRELLELFGAGSVLLVAKATETGVVRVWAGVPGVPGDLSIAGRAEEPEYLPPLPEAVAIDRRRAEAVPSIALDDDGRVARAAVLPPRLGGRPWSMALSAAFVLGDDWTGRVYVLDPARGRRGASALRFLRRLVGEVAPAVESVYLLARLRARAGAMERARVARELHDGVLQSLIGLEMQVDVLRRRAEQEAPGARGLTHVQAHLRHEIITVRELMEEIRPVEVSPRDLVEHVAAMVERFRHETGIGAEFVCDAADVELPGRTCREVVKVVQEALVNVRRHSGARNVMVRLGGGPGGCTLVVDDDGKGLPFAGRLDERALEAQRVGPLVIRERVMALGGRLAIESQPGRGTRLEVRLPRTAHD